MFLNFKKSMSYLYTYMFFDKISNFGVTCRVTNFELKNSDITKKRHQP